MNYGWQVDERMRWMRCVYVREREKSTFGYISVSPFTILIAITAWRTHTYRAALLVVYAVETNTHTPTWIAATFKSRATRGWRKLIAIVWCRQDWWRKVCTRRGHSVLSSRSFDIHWSPSSNHACQLPFILFVPPGLVCVCLPLYVNVHLNVNVCVCLSDCQVKYGVHWRMAPMSSWKF